MDALKGEEFESFDRSIDVHISKLRAKLEREPRRSRATSRPCAASATCWRATDAPCATALYSADLLRTSHLGVPVRRAVVGIFASAWSSPPAGARPSSARLGARLARHVAAQLVGDWSIDPPSATARVQPHLRGARPRPDGARRSRGELLAGTASCCRPLGAERARRAARRGELVAEHAPRFCRRRAHRARPAQCAGVLEASPLYAQLPHAEPVAAGAARRRGAAHRRRRHGAAGAAHLARRSSGSPRPARRLRRAATCLASRDAGRARCCAPAASPPAPSARRARAS